VTARGGEGNLSSAVRVYVFENFRNRSTACETD